MTRFMLAFYSRLFLFFGAVFVAFEGPWLRLLSWAGGLAGAAPLPPSGPSLWLGLTGSLMCVIAWLSRRLSQNPREDAAWNALLLSKAVSSGLFLVFFALARNPLLLAAAAVDGAILAHLAWLRAGLERETARTPRSAAPAPFHEAWFARLNDPATGRAFWARYSRVGREHGVESACWAIFFDPSGKTAVRRWTGEADASSCGRVFGMGESGLELGRLSGRGEGAAWDLRWSAGACPPLPVVPAWLRALGLTRAGYDDLAPDAVFDGWAEFDGRRWDFSRARGCLGRVWGARYAPGWRWAHALFETPEGPAVFELLTAPGPLGLSATTAFLWLDGRLRAADGPLSLLLTRSRREGGRWSFSVSFDGAIVEGECELGPAALLRYEGPRGERLDCRNSKLSTMRLCVSEGGRARELSTRAAAVEFVEAAP